MILPAVANAKHDHSGGLYIGRRFGDYDASVWMNPFRVGDDTEENRITAIWRYAVWVLNQPVRFQLAELRQHQALVCWCAPKLCHGHVLQWLLAHQQFDAACNKCGEPLRSKMNIYQHELGPNLALVYEQGECHNAKCRHYRFTHTGYITPDIIPDWVESQTALIHG